MDKWIRGGWVRRKNDKGIPFEEFENYLPLTDSQLEQILMRDLYCKDPRAIYLLKNTDHERLKPHISYLLEFLQDMNWPAARDAADLLVEMGRDVIPEVKKLFIHEHDTGWIASIILSIVKTWNPEMVKEIEEELIEIVKKADSNDASISALGVLKEKKILPQNEIDQLYSILKGKFLERHPENNRDSLLDYLEDCMQNGL